MKKAIFITSFFAIIALLPGASFAQSYIYSTPNDLAPMPTLAPTMNQPVYNTGANSASYSTYTYGDPNQNNTNTLAPNNSNTGNTQNVTTYNDSTDIGENPLSLRKLFGINTKTKAEKEQEKLAADAAAAKSAEDARVARNPDGSIAYGYTNSSGAKYVAANDYTDARNSNVRYVTRNSRNTAAAGNLSLGNMLPTTFWGWVLLIVLLSILVAIIRAIIDKSKKHDTHGHAHH